MMEYRTLDFIGFEEYQINTTGEVYSLNYNKTGKKRLLKPQKDKSGYMQVQLCKDGKHKAFYVHRLVAEAFIPNPYNLPEVNHKNEDKTDNRVENLEFCDRKYNVNYGTGIKRRTEKQTNRSDQSKPVNQYTKEGMLVAQYPSTAEASRQTGFEQGNISRCCRGERKTHKKYIWEYA